MDENIRESGTAAPNHGSNPEEWVRPVLRRLAITATGGVPGSFNEGVGKGKANGGSIPVS